MTPRRVIVVGAGPAGSAAAMSLRRTPGVEVLLLDAATFPRRKACGSGLSPWCLELLDAIGVGPRIRSEALPIGAARIGGPGTTVLELRSRFQAAVLLRERFDHLLAMEAVRRGAELREGVKAREIVRENGSLLGVRTTGGDLEADAVVVANGANTTLGRARRPGRTLNTYMAWYEGVEDLIDAVELYFDPVVKPYYGWVFPEGGRRANVGVVFQPRSGRPNARERFDEFVATRLRTRLRGATRIGRPIGHPVATSARPTRLVTDGVLVAGEAGRLVDPGTAEGIHHALASGWLAGARLGALAAAGEPYSRENLASYGRDVRRQLGGRLLAGGALLQAARTPVLGWMIRFGGLAPVRALLTRALAGA